MDGEEDELTPTPCRHQKIIAACKTFNSLPGGKSRSYWRCFYGIILIALGIGAGLAAWKMKYFRFSNAVIKPLYDQKLYKVNNLC